MKKQLERIILAAYGKKKHGESTLEIPMRTLAITCVLGFVMAFVTDYIYLNYLERCAVKTLSQKTVNVSVNNQDKKSFEDVKLERLKKLLTPDLRRKIHSDFNTDEYEPLLKGDKINIQNFKDYLKSISEGNYQPKIEKEFDTYITGVINVKTFYPQFIDSNAVQILMNIGMEKPNLESPTTIELPEVIRFGICATLINKFRSELGSDYSSPRRLMQALGANIQFITYWFALWALSLIGLRFFWCLVQRNIIDSGKLKNDTRQIIIDENGKQKSISASVWLFDRYSNTSDSILSDYRNKYGSGLLPVRIIDEAIELKHENHIPDNIYQFTNDKIDLLESGVQKGEYEIINYLVFAIPNLGFIGTIIGIVLSMASVSGIIESSAQLDQLASFDKVGGTLGYAFDTTAVSLFWVLILSLILAFVKKMEADMFESLRAKTITALKYYWGANS